MSSKLEQKVTMKRLKKNTESILEQHSTLIQEHSTSLEPFKKNLHLIANNIARISVIDLENLIKQHKGVLRDDESLTLQEVDKHLSSALHTLETYLTKN